MPTPAKKRYQRPPDGGKLSPDSKFPRHKEDDNASNPENMATGPQASPETNSDINEIKEMHAVIQDQIATVLSDKRKIQRDPARPYDI